MSWVSRLFGSRLSDADRESGLALIRHLQTMFAYQQLSTETYNDALAEIAGIEAPPPRSEGLGRPSVQLSNPEAIVEAIVEVMIPALDQKRKILAKMRLDHEAMRRPAAPELRDAYDDFSALLGLMQERGKAQTDAALAYADAPTYQGLATDQLDAAEHAALLKSTASLNDLISKIGLKKDDWLVLNRDCFNAVRATVGLPPMSDDSYRATFYAGLAGQPVRFFSS